LSTGKVTFIPIYASLFPVISSPRVFSLLSGIFGDDGDDDDYDDDKINVSQSTTV
jgi:hypothetical protein